MKLLKKTIIINITLILVMVVASTVSLTSLVGASNAQDFAQISLETIQSQESLEVVSSDQTASAVLEKEVVAVESIVEKIPTVSMNVCNTTATFKSYMSYKAITLTSSPQYKLQSQAATGDYGIRMVNGRYLIAMASTYGEVGDELNLTLSSGKVIYVMIGDIKGNTDCTHADGSLIEFIVDISSMNGSVQSSGNFNILFKGSVTAIDKVI